MVLSMTGYGRAEQVLNGRDIVVELRSVNSRFFEYSSRVPRTCSFLEDKLKKLVAAKVSRGKVELNLSIQNVAAADTVVQVNWQLAKSYQTAMQAMSEKLDLKNDVTVSTICRFPDVLTQTAAPADPDTLWADVEQVAQQTHTPESAIYGVSASVLPQVIDSLTPQGGNTNPQEANNDIQQVLNMVGGFLK